jgi:hypothetical protein
VQGAQQDVRDHIRVHVRPLGRDERGDMAVPEAVDRMIVLVAALLCGYRLRRAAEGELRQEALVAADDLDDGVKEGEQALPVGRPWPQRRRP